jgi:hypothetical protein
LSRSKGLKMKLTNQELTTLLAVLSPTGTDFQAGRIVRLLASGPNRTGIIASRCSVGNLSDVILKKINPAINPLGFWVGCQKPPQVIRNKFNQPAGDWIYQINKVPTSAANDDEGSSIDDWQKELAPTFSSPE